MVLIASIQFPLPARARAERGELLPRLNGFIIILATIIVVFNKWFASVLANCIGTYERLRLLLIEMTIAQIIDLFAGKLNPNVYQLVSPISAIELADLSRDAGAKLFYLDGRQISDRESLFYQFAIVMQFSDYFGHNWDALWDSLTDIDVDDAERQIIVIDRFDNFERDNPQQWSILFDICQRIVEYYRDTTTPMYILLCGELAQLQQANLTSI